MLHCCICVTRWWISEWKKGALSRQATFTIDEVRVRRQIPKTFAWSFAWSFAFFYSLLEKEDWGGSEYRSWRYAFFQIFEIFFFYPSVDKGQYLHVVFRNKFKHIINSRNWKSFTDGFVTLPIRFHGELNYFSYANTLFLSILLLVSQ